MRVLFDIAHPAHVNFFRRLIYRLRDEGHTLLLVCLGRGKVPQIAAREFPDMDLRVVGAHCPSLLGAYLRTGLWREFQLARVIRQFRPDLAVGVAAFQVAMLGRWFGFASLGVSDDPEHRTIFKLSRRYLDCFLLPECLGVSGENIVTFRGLKEWSYLSPRHFRPDESALERHGLRRGEYVFIRDVITTTLNYRHQAENNVLGLYEAGLRSHRVVLSLEDKSLRQRYADWQVLEEPVGDIHSIIYFARAAVSSGDSMAREAAELGVPSFYCGRRLMRANAALIDLGYLRHEMDVRVILESLTSSPPPRPEEQQARRQRLMELWDDPTEVAYRQLMDLASRGRR